MKLLPSQRDFADVFLLNTHSEERGEITFFLPLELMIGAANGRKGRRDTGAIVRAIETETARASLLPGRIVRETPPRIWFQGTGGDHFVLSPYIPFLQLDMGGRSEEAKKKTVFLLHFPYTRKE